jgi:hypothetical protein
VSPCGRLPPARCGPGLPSVAIVATASCPPALGVDHCLPTGHRHPSAAVRRALPTCPTLKAKRSPDVIRHYAGFRTMSCNGTRLRFGSMILGPIMQDRRQFARHRPVPAAGCSGRRERRRGVTVIGPSGHVAIAKAPRVRFWALRERPASLSMIKIRVGSFPLTRS